MSDPVNPLRLFATRVTLSLLRGGKMVLRAVWPVLSKTAAFLGGGIVRVLALPAYRLAMNVKLRSRSLMLPARGAVLLVFTNRYLVHVVVIGVALATIATNLSIRQANAQDTGRESLLYAMVTGDDARLTEQQVDPALVIRDSRYTGASSLMATADIDFDYDEEDPHLTAISVPGTIVADGSGPEAHTPDEPSGSVAPRTNTETYVVQSGDTLSAVAKRFNVNVGTILWANARTEFQYLRPGDVLKIPPVSGVLVTVKKGDTLLALANKYGSSAEEILRVNRLSPDEALPVGLEVTLPGGQPPAAPIAVRTPIRVNEPGPGTVTTKPPAADVTTTPVGKLQWPTSGRVITQYYGWRHTGLDIDGDYTSPIYASHDGKVTTAGWNSGGYGMQIVITGNGVMTRYAHSSKMFVKVGDEVKKGDVIAMVGTTGRSTGTHLHYEVYINGKRTNPLSYTR